MVPLAEEARQRLGDPDLLVASMLAQPGLRSLPSRLPAFAWLALPLIAELAIVAGLAALVVAAARHGFVPSTAAIVNPLLLMAPLGIAWSIGKSALRRRAGPGWPLAGMLATLIAAAALELWRDRLGGAVVAIVNAPASLFHLRDVLRAGGLWQRLIALDPADEQAQCALMQAALDAGNRVEAIRQFNQLRDNLHAELGVGPSAATIALYEKALALSSTETVSSSERVRTALAWGLVHLQSGAFDKASDIARETRDLALGADLPREVGEASALLGLSSMMRAQWPQLFRSEFIEWVRARPAFVKHVFDGHLCLSEFCLCSAKGHAEVAGLARELLSVAEEAGSVAGRGLACLLLGEAALFSGELDEAEDYLGEAERLLLEADAVAGRVLAIERLAEIALERGQKWRAGRLIQRGLADAERSWLSPHLIMRMQALAVRAAATPKMVAEEILAGDRLMTPGACQPCSMALRTASAIALAEAGKLEEVDHRLNEAERIAGMWHGGPWAAALWEARGVQRRAQKKEVRALAAFEEAASRYEELGRPRDQARCLARMSPEG